MKKQIILSLLLIISTDNVNTASAWESGATPSLIYRIMSFLNGDRNKAEQVQNIVWCAQRAAMRQISVMPEDEFYKDPYGNYERYFFRNYDAEVNGRQAMLDDDTKKLLETGRGFFRSYTQEYVFDKMLFGKHSLKEMNKKIKVFSLNFLEDEYNKK